MRFSVRVCVCNAKAVCSIWCARKVFGCVLSVCDFLRARVVSVAFYHKEKKVAFPPLENLKP